MNQKKSPHSFYIPVMGSGFTIDTPLFVAKYGISSVISLVDDLLIEQMRKYWCEKLGEEYIAVDAKSDDARSLRITAYLNLLKKIIDKQIIEVKGSPFKKGTEITKYFEMLPDGDIKDLYKKMLSESDEDKKMKLQEQLRQEICVGGIDVNIMTKLDRPNYYRDEVLAYEYYDAASALRGYANSDLTSVLVLSAGFNPHLYGYMTKFADFFPDENYFIKKKICLKVSDYRSAVIQGKYLAKRGLWVSEYRIESALNCGGHAFVNDGQLLGPILEEFKERKNELIEMLYGYYKSALLNLKKNCSDVPPIVKITAQGGIGTNVEHNFLINYYNLDGAGWGTPFLLVPEATNVDDVTLDKLLNAKDDDVFLSTSSPLGVPFWNLKNSMSEEARIARIKAGVPGSACVKGYARLNTEFTQKPICQASREYQKLKLKELETSNLPTDKLKALTEDVLSKSCICHELSGGVLVKDNIDTKITPAICPGPNIINFKKIVTLREMINHIYGHISLIINDKRPHVFVRELQLQINHLLGELKNASAGFPARSQQKLAEVKENLSQGIEYYKKIAKEILKEKHESFLQALQELQDKINELNFSHCAIKD